MFGRISTAMVTPFDNNGNIDFQKTEKLVEYLIHHGTDSIVVAGTTGESPTLTTEEKLALFKHVVSVVNKRVPVIAGTGTNNTRASIELTKKGRTNRRRCDYACHSILQQTESGRDLSAL